MTFEESLTSLEPDETSRRFDPALLDSPSWEAQRDLCTNFRHSGWLDQRTRTLAALVAAETEDGTRKRFCECGSVAWIAKSDSATPSYRLITNRCRNRFCRPCASEHSRTVIGNVASKLVDREVRMLTLTLKNADVTLEAQIDRLLDGFRKLRKTAIVKGRMWGGMYFVEVKIGKQSNQWHPHLHILFEGAYMNQQALANAWLKITGDSYILDIRAFRNSRVAAGYVAKYATKCLSSSVEQDHDRLTEAVVALTGRRTFQTFGTWRNLGLSKPKADDQTWTVVASLITMLTRAKQGDPEAIAILDNLRGDKKHEPITALPCNKGDPTLPGL